MKRMKLALLSAVVVVCLASAAGAQQAGVPLLLQTAMQPPASATQTYAYDFETVTSGTRASTIRGRIDPSRPEGQRVTITEAVGADVDIRKIDKRMEEDADGDIWCDSMSGGVDSAVRELPQRDGARVFSFTPKPPAAAETDQKKLYKQLVAEVLVDEQTQKIRQFNARLTKPWKPMVLAKLESVQMVGDCRMAPNGRAYSSSTLIHLKGSALGNDFETRTEQTVSNLEEIR